SGTWGTLAGKSRSGRTRRSPPAPWRADFPATRTRAGQQPVRSFLVAEDAGVQHAARIERLLEPAAHSGHRAARKGRRPQLLGQPLTDSLRLRRGREGGCEARDILGGVWNDAAYHAASE